MMDSLRLRLVFQSPNILSESQRSEGLNRSWLLLRPRQHGAAISDLSSHISNIFHLHHSCPNGLVLSVDGFVLPPFESTCILRDNDVISVKRKGRILPATVEVGDGTNVIEEEVQKKQHLLTAGQRSANDFEKVLGSCCSESEEDEDQPENKLHVENSSGGTAVSKKRKASKKHQSAKKKKKCSMVLPDIENAVQTEQNVSCHSDGLHHGKTINMKNQLYEVKSKPKRASKPRNAARSNGISERFPSLKRFGELQENVKGCADICNIPDGSGKVWYAITFSSFYAILIIIYFQVEKTVFIFFFKFYLSLIMVAAMKEEESRCVLVVCCML
ncbi:coilin-like [Diospyros lotus]|uniref:coilin-like n=1 Tax=Diospyros lotus TaxID=55363 RepID=UPI00224F96B3|nr:coilin-like [Diospyros lotus]